MLRLDFRNDLFNDLNCLIPISNPYAKLKPTLDTLVGYGNIIDSQFSDCWYRLSFWDKELNFTHSVFLSAHEQ